jgi:polyribonucleotide nucleotidyltransferase
MKKPVSGIAMGLMKDGDTELVLTDIKGTEDFVGDMDFKLAGTDAGMTAIQMDTKLQGLGVAKLQEMLDRAQAGRTDILSFMNETISTHSATISPYAPFLLKFKVEAEQVREIIGKG